MQFWFDLHLIELRITCQILVRHASFTGIQIRAWCHQVIVYSTSQMAPHISTDHFLDVFNYILSSGKFPKPWNINTLSPLHKKGPANKHGNYRGIAVSSCIAKVFLSILHNRLYKFVHTKELIPPNQIGYKKGSRTTDHILTLKNIIDKYIHTTPRRYLYACFVDFKSAFDTVWREGMFYKMVKWVLVVIYWMYSRACIPILSMQWKWMVLSPDHLRLV